MSDFLSLSLFQLLSVLSFLTSVIAVLRLGPGSLHRFSHKYEPQVSASSTEMGVGADKPASWSWSLTGLPVSFSWSTLIGDEEPGQDAEDDVEKLSAGASQVVRMNWQLAKPRSGQCALLSLTRPCSLNMVNHSTPNTTLTSPSINGKAHHVPSCKPFRDCLVPPRVSQGSVAQLTSSSTSFQSQRKPFRIPRRTPGMPRPTPPSRLVGSAV